MAKVWVQLVAPRDKREGKVGSREPAMSQSGDEQNMAKWPWDSSNDNLTDSVLQKVVDQLAWCALDAAWERNPEEVGLSRDSLWVEFQTYCHVVKDYFQERAEGKPELREIAKRAFGLIDDMLNCVSRISSHPIHSDSERDRLSELTRQWDTLVRTFALRSRETQEIASQGTAEGEEATAQRRRRVGRPKIDLARPRASPLAGTKGVWVVVSYSIAAAACDKNMPGVAPTYI